MIMRTNDKRRLAYQWRKQGDTWQSIADRLGYTGQNSAILCAEEHAKNSGLPWPLEFTYIIKQKRAYELREKTRLPWEVIAKKMGYISGSSARRAALKHAKKKGLHWPIKYLTKAEIVHIMETSEGMDRGEIAIELGLKMDTVHRLMSRHRANQNKEKEV